MTIALPHNHHFSRLGYLLASKVSALRIGLVRLAYASWSEFRKNQFMLIASYRKHATAGAMPKRTWDRHSALLMAMKGRPVP